MPKKTLSKQKKMSTRVDFTPMVDMMMLLITFFMLCTTLNKPQTMQLTMPSNDKNVNKNDQSETKASQTITIYIGANNKIYYGKGLPQYTNPGWLTQTTYGKNGIRKVLINHRTGDGTDPVAQIMLAKQKLDAQKLKNPAAWPDSVYQKALSKLRDGYVNGDNNAPIPTLTIVIKPLTTCSYKNLVDVLDEMQICSIGKYVIDKVNAQDLSLCKLKGIK